MFYGLLGLVGGSENTSFGVLFFLPCVLLCLLRVHVCALPYLFASLGFVWILKEKRRGEIRGRWGVGGCGILLNLTLILFDTLYMVMIFGGKEGTRHRHHQPHHPRPFLQILRFYYYYFIYLYGKGRKGRKR